jgi:hypothetical protein
MAPLLTSHTVMRENGCTHRVSFDIGCSLSLSLFQICLLDYGCSHLELILGLELVPALIECGEDGAGNEFDLGAGILGKLRRKTSVKPSCKHVQRDLPPATYLVGVTLGNGLHVVYLDLVGHDQLV